MEHSNSRQLFVSIILLLVSSLFFFGFKLSTSSLQDNDCISQNFTLETISNTEATGQLLYLETVMGENMGILASTDIDFTEITVPSREISLSPNGLWVVVADDNFDAETYIIYIYSLTDDTIITLNTGQFTGYYRLENWLTTEEILIIYAGFDNYFPVMVLNIFSGEIQMVDSEQIIGIDREPFITGTNDNENFSASPDGRFVLHYIRYSDELQIYDRQNDIYLIVPDNFTGRAPFLPRWSPNSQTLFYFGSLNTTVDAIFTLDIESITIRRIADFSRPTGSITTFANGWSPDMSKIAFAVTETTTDDDNVVSSELYLAELINDEVFNTCFRSGSTRFELAWSRDSRYLALQGVLDGEDMDESLGVNSRYLPRSSRTRRHRGLDD